MLFFELILDFLILLLDFQFLKDLKKKRAIEKENKLQQKREMLPSTKIFIIVVSITLIFLFSFSIYKMYFGIEKKAIEKLAEIKELLHKEKESFGTYPENLSEIIRNNPLRKNITLDICGNEYHYEQLENGRKYTLLSKGKDGILNTNDDINNK